MIPIIYKPTNSERAGYLHDCTRCIVTEERNGIYECEFDYPVTGAHFEDIVMGGSIECTHDEQGDTQLFDIYAVGEPIDGIVTYNAHHISYRLNENTVKPFTAGSCTEALSKIKSQSVETNPFTFWTDKSVTADYESKSPRKARQILGGEENSILDVFGTGEYEFDNYDVKLHLHRGQDTNVSIRYGKNLVDFTNEENSEDLYTAVVPFWLGTYSEESTEIVEPGEVLITLPEWYISSGQSSPSGRAIIVPMDLTSDFSTKPTVSELRSKAQSKLTASKAWQLKQTITVDFVQLWQTDEYKDYAPLQRVRLCDTVGVFVPMYNISLRAKIIKVVYNVLLDRYDEMELGDSATTFTAVVEKIYDSKVAKVYTGFQATKVDIATVASNAAKDATAKVNAAKETIEEEYEAAIAEATDLICGGTGGYVITTLNANGQPIELLITDNIDLEQAVNVWRWNSGGLGHSSTGYQGPFSDIAITQDGKINASMILTGILTANLITAGTITDTSGKNYWNLDSGQFVTMQGTVGPLTIDETSLTYETGPSYNKKLVKIDRSGMTARTYKYASGPYNPGNETAGILIDEDEIDFIAKIHSSGINDYDVVYRMYTWGGSSSSTGSYAWSIQNMSNKGLSVYNDYVVASNDFQMWYDASVSGNLTVYGTKSRNVKTDNYSDRLLYCYETPTPLFGDIGEAVLDEEGYCYIDIDDIFSETIAERTEYQVFLQKEGEGDCWISEKDPRYFTIQGTPGLRVAWELKAKQKDYQNIRLEQSENGLDEYEKTDIYYLSDYIAEQEALLYG